jgi:hypothetical protein
MDIKGLFLKPGVNSPKQLVYIENLVILRYPAMPVTLLTPKASASLKTYDLFLKIRFQNGFKTISKRFQNGFSY